MNFQRARDAATHVQILGNLQEQRGAAINVKAEPAPVEAAADRRASRAGRWHGLDGLLLFDHVGDGP